jgi:ABC-type transport system involved in cytochrome c biogenesis permease subunit
LQNSIDALSLVTLSIYILAFAANLVSIFLGRKSALLYRSFLLTGVALHLAVLIIRSYLVGHAPMANLYETLLFFSFCAALATAIYDLRYRNGMAGIISIPVASGLLVNAIRGDHKITPLYIALKTIWFEIHVMSSFAGYALFTISFASAIFFLVYRNREQAKARIFDEMTNSANVWGFAFFSFAMFSGAIWAYLAWGNYWFWEPKTIWSFILWFYFAGIIHGHYLKQWRGKRVAIMTVFGFAVVIFTYIGVGLLMKSSHNL